MRGLLTKLALAAVLTASIIGCVPMRVSEVPDLTGRVRRGAEPVSGAILTWLTLGLRSESDPVRATGSGVTNAHGDFTIAGQRAWGTGALVPAHALVRWRLEMVSGQERTVLWQDSMVVPGRRSTPGRIKIDCDLAEANPCLLVDTDSPRLGPVGTRLGRAGEEHH